MPGTELVPIVTDPPWEVGPLFPPELGVVLFAHADMTRAAAATIQTSRIRPPRRTPQRNRVGRFDRPKG
jgi:hypothetical protein